MRYWGRSARLAGQSEQYQFLHPEIVRMIRALLHVIALSGVFLIAPSQIEGATINAKSVSLGDVGSAIGSARDGDTVLIPAGTASWNSTLAIAKGITLQGAGNDKTVILDDVPREVRAIQQSSKGPGNGFPGQSVSGQVRLKAGPTRGLMMVELKLGQFFRLTGLTFRYGSVTTKADAPLVRVKGTSPAVRVDHCHFDQLFGAGILFYGWIYGVVDHCRWDERTQIGSNPAIIVNNGATWGGGANDFGDGSSAAPTAFGSDKFLFIEDNVFHNLGTVQTAGGIDCQDGGRYVSRHNQFFNCTMITGHGTESGGRHRGQRAIEFYDNKETVTVHQSIGITRSGVTIYHSNSWTGPMKAPNIPLVVFRELWPYPMFNGANGDSPWDLNDTEGNGTNVPDHRPHLHASGRHTGANASSGTLVSSGAGWRPNQWVGYMVTNTTQSTPRGMHLCSRILSNTSDTIVYDTQTPDNQPKTFNTGDGFAIYKLLVALDQPGRGKGDLLAGNPPYNTVTGGSNWPHQALEPIYAWNNAINGVPVKVGSTYPTLQENRDYYNQTDAFDGTVGVGVGLLADRPKTCTPGVAYWATDQGKWDSTHSGPDGQLYVCTEPNTWSLYYKPYTYPHPLVSGSPAPRSSKGAENLMGE
jgi:hypothetical protein